MRSLPQNLFSSHPISNFHKSSIVLCLLLIKGIVFVFSVLFHEIFHRLWHLTFLHSLAYCLGIWTMISFSPTSWLRPRWIRRTKKRIQSSLPTRQSGEGFKGAFIFWGAFQQRQAGDGFWSIEWILKIKVTTWKSIKNSHQASQP